MIGLSKISCIALLMCLPFAAYAQEDVTEVALSEGTMTVAEATNDVVLGKIDATEPVVVTEPLPEDAVQVLLAKAQQENAKRTNMRTADLTQTECLATAMYHEARGEGERGLRAVAYVIHNRVESGKYPNDYCGVVTQPAQFSFVGDKHPDNIKDWNLYQKILAMAVHLLDNGGFQSDASPVGGAMFFHAVYCHPAWRKTRHFIATIGNHRFFK